MQTKTITYSESVVGVARNGAFLQAGMVLTAFRYVDGPCVDMQGLTSRGNAAVGLSIPTAQLPDVILALQEMQIYLTKEEEAES